MATQLQVIDTKDVAKNDPAAPSNQPTPQAGSQGSSGVGSNPVQACGGSNFSAGIAASIYNFVDFLNELSANEGMVNAMNIAIKLSESKVEQETTKEEYAKQAMGQWMDMGKDLLGAATSFGTVLFENKDINIGGKSFSNAGTLNKEFDLQNDQLAELRGINKEAKNKLLNPSSGDMIQRRGAVIPEAERVSRLKEMEGGTLIPDNKVVPESSAKQEIAKESIAQEKIQQEDPTRFATNEQWDAHFKTERGQLETVAVQNSREMEQYFSSEEGQKALVEKMNELDRTNGMNAIRGANMGDPAQQAAVQKIKDESDREITNLLKKNETTMTGINANRARAKMGFEIMKGVGDSVFDANKATFTREVGAIKAENQAATYSKQTLDQMSQNLSQQIKENVDTLRSFLSGLAQAATRA